MRLTVGVLLTAGALAAGCAETPASPDPASSGPAASGPAASGPASSGPASSGPASSGPASAGVAAALADVLRAPPGFAPYSHPLAGPITTPDEVATVFADHPGDAEFLLGHGFRAGYLRGWARETGTTTATSTVDRTIAQSIVVRFATPADARAFVTRSRDLYTTDGFTPFPVPAALPGGWGGRSTGSAGVLWTRGTDLYSLVFTSATIPPSTDELVRAALAQN